MHMLTVFHMLQCRQRSKACMRAQHTATDIHIHNYRNRIVDILSEFCFGLRLFFGFVDFQLLHWAQMLSVAHLFLLYLWQVVFRGFRSFVTMREYAYVRRTFSQRHNSLRTNHEGPLKYQPVQSGFEFLFSYRLVGIEHSAGGGDSCRCCLIADLQNSRLSLIFVFRRKSRNTSGKRTTSNTLKAAACR